MTHINSQNEQEIIRKSTDSYRRVFILRIQRSKETEAEEIIEAALLEFASLLKQIIASELEHTSHLTIDEIRLIVLQLRKKVFTGKMSQYLLNEKNKFLLLTCNRLIERIYRLKEEERKDIQETDEGIRGILKDHRRYYKKGMKIIIRDTRKNIPTLRKQFANIRPVHYHLKDMFQQKRPGMIWLFKDNPGGIS